MTTHSNLVMMANQIARNFAVLGDAAAAAATADHLRRFWAPRMRAALAATDPGLSPVASAALRQLGGNAD